MGYKEIPTLYLVAQSATARIVDVPATDVDDGSSIVYVLVPQILARSASQTAL